MEQQIAVSGDSFRINTKDKKKRPDNDADSYKSSVLPLKASSISVSEVIKLIAFFVGLLAGCILLGFFIGGFANAWDGVTLFLEAIKLGTDWGVGVLTAALALSSIATLLAANERLFSDVVLELRARLSITPDLDGSPTRKVEHSLSESSESSTAQHLAQPIHQAKKTLEGHPQLNKNASKLASSQNPAHPTPPVFATCFFEDIWGHTAKYLDYYSLSSLMVTCKFFNNFSQMKAISDAKPPEKIIVRQRNTFMLLGNGTFYACGTSEYGQLGLGNGACYPIFTPIKIDGLGEGISIQQIITGGKHTFVLLSNGALYGCGCNQYGQLGLGNRACYPIFTPIKIDGLGEGISIQQIIAGDNHTFVLWSNGALYGCGNNKYGQLGLNDTNHRSTFTRIKIDGLGEGISIQQVIVGYNHTFVLLSNGALYGCGDNEYGQLGLGDTQNRFTFSPIKIQVKLSDNGEGISIQQVIAGDSHIFVLLSNGALYGCGKNGYGQLGLNDTNNRSTFTRIKIDDLDKRIKIQQVIAGGNHTFVLLSDGALHGCGSNGFGELGLNDMDHRSTFMRIKIDMDENVGIRQIIAGGYNTFVLLRNGELYSRGMNESGQLGIGNFITLRPDGTAKNNGFEHVSKINFAPQEQKISKKPSPCLIQ